MNGGSHAPPTLQSLIASLTQVDIDALHSVFARLSVDDLRVLGAFPSQPHPLIHAVLACAHCLSLTISAQHQKIELDVVPWPLLRLELLTNTTQVWQKLAKRLHKLEKRKQPLAPAQIRFVHRQLSSFYERDAANAPRKKTKAATSSSSSSSSNETYPSALEMYARVSTIGAGLAAWIYLCLSYASDAHASKGFVQRQQQKRLDDLSGGGSSADNVSASILSQKRPPDGQRVQLGRGSERQSPQKTPTLPHIAAAPGPTIVGVRRTPCESQGTKSCGKNVSVRAGIKIGDRYFLFQAKCQMHHGFDDPLSSSRQGQTRQVAPSIATRWAVLRIETNRKAVQWKRSYDACNSDSSPLSLSEHRKATVAKEDPTHLHCSDAFWHPPQRIPWRLFGSLSAQVDRIPPLALTTTLVQLGIHAEMFENTMIATTTTNQGVLLRSLPSSPSKRQAMDAAASLALAIPILLKFAVISLPMNRSTKQQRKRQLMSLVGIGSAAVHTQMTVAALRQQLQAAMATRVDRSESSSTSATTTTTSGTSDSFRSDGFSFVYRGSLLPATMETDLSAVSLMPFALMICEPCSRKNAGGGPADQVTLPSSYRQMALQIQTFELEIAHALRNTGAPNHLPLMKQWRHNAHAEEEATQQQHVSIAYYTMHQEITAIPSTSAVLVEFFVNWKAFVHFQMLQDSTAILEFSMSDQRQKTKSKKRCKTEAQKIAEFAADRRSHHTLLMQAVRDETQGLPHRRFNPEKEYLKPVYATADVNSLSSAILTSPFLQELSELLALETQTTTSNNSNLRLVLRDEDHLVHVLSVTRVSKDGHGGSGASTAHCSSLHLEFQRDASCPADSLVLLRGVYVWQVVKIHSNTHHQQIRQQIPEKWLQDVYRFVIHPTLDYKAVTTAAFNFFRVPLPCHHAETIIENHFWSRNIDWEPLRRHTSLLETVLRQKFVAMCHSHPPSYAIDSVKFSKFLRECELQPDLLSIGDVAFLFASHVAIGSHYEMDFDGFVHALEKIAVSVYPSSSLSPKQRAKEKQQRQATSSEIEQEETEAATSSLLLPQLARLFFERLICAPSMTRIWHDLINTWRLERKLEFLECYARRFCAATRIQSLWKRFVTKRIHLATLLRMKAERRAATKIQSMQRKRRAYQPYQRLREQAIRIQRRIKARHQLRSLRADRAAFLDNMSIRIAKWMKQRLRVLKEWKKINAAWVTRRDRIAAKRKRLICVAIHELETRRFRFSLYHADHNVVADRVPNAVAFCPELLEDDVGASYELEVLEATSCWWRFVRLPRSLVNQFLRDEEHGYFATQKRMEQQKQPLGDAGKTSSALQVQTMGLTNGARGAKTRSSSSLSAVVKRLYLQLGPRISPSQSGSEEMCVKYYRNPIRTSLGKLVFNGAVSIPAALPRSRCCRHRSALHVVKILQSMDLFKVIVYTPTSSSLQRWDLSAHFLSQVLKYSRFQGMTLSPSPPPVSSALSLGERDASTLNATQEEEEEEQHVLLRVKQYLGDGVGKVIVVRHLVRYVLAYGLQPPVYENMPEVIAEKHRRQEEEERVELQFRLAREEKLVVFAQARVRRFLARSHRLQLALSTYQKQFDRAAGSGFLYVNRFSPDRLIYQDKPLSLFDCDVPFPKDEWLEVSDDPPASQYYNPFRGAFSQFNGEKVVTWIVLAFALHLLLFCFLFVQAAMRIQRWFRRKMWIGISEWNLRQLSLALRYHQDVHKPTDLCAADQVEAMKRYASHLHIMQHEIASGDVETLVGVALLLIYSCQYPTKQTWPRALTLLTHAKTLDPDLKMTLKRVEANCFCWKMFLHPKDASAIGNYAVFLQCIHHEFDKAELLYRRAIDLDPSNDMVLENYRRLERERAPGGIYSFAGPGKIALWRAKEIGRIDSTWRVMEDLATRIPSAKRFYHNAQTGVCTWETPEEPVQRERID